MTRRLSGGGRLEPNARRLRGALNEGLGVLLGVLLHATFYFPSLEGRIAMPAPAAGALGGHALLVVGYVDDEGDGGGLFIVRNSWGPDWGANGYGFLPYAYVDAFGIQAWALGVDDSPMGDRTK
jgi:hypothetical protein